MFKGTSTRRSFSAIRYKQKVVFVIVEAQCQSLIIQGERRKRGRVRTDLYIYAVMQGINRQIHTSPSFIRRAGCHTSLGFSGMCQLLMHTMCPLRDFIMKKTLRCENLSRERVCLGPKFSPSQRFQCTSSLPLMNVFLMTNTILSK